MAMPLWLIVAVAFINPIFEETFIVGYLFERGKSFGFWVIFATSCLIRVSYHLYQGWLGVISILPYGIIFALAYARTRNLWPLVLAHAMQDFIAFGFSPH